MEYEKSDILISGSVLMFLSFSMIHLNVALRMTGTLIGFCGP